MDRMKWPGPKTDATILLLNKQNSVDSIVKFEQEQFSAPYISNFDKLVKTKLLDG